MGVLIIEAAFNYLLYMKELYFLLKLLQTVVIILAFLKLNFFLRIF